MGARGPVHRLKRAVLDARERYGQRYAFVHINKTGGTSIVRALGMRFQHRTAAEMRAKLGDRRWERRFTFSVVRNPWDRAVSLYHFRVDTDQTGLGDGRLSFPDWAVAVYRDRDPELRDKPRMFAPQTWWLAGADGRPDVDRVARFERLGADFDDICRRIGVRAELPHLKASRRGDYRRYYTPAAHDAVADAFASDIAEWGYRFDPDAR